MNTFTVLHRLSSNHYYYYYCNVSMPLTWKYKMMVHIRPSTTGGLPSTKSAGLMLTNLIFLLAKNCSAVLALLRKCGRRKTLPLSIGCFKKIIELCYELWTTGEWRENCTLTSFSPDRTSNKASNLVPSRKSWIKSAIRSGGTR